MATMTLSVDRTSLGKSTLVFYGSDLDANLWVETVGRPSKTWRREYATSPYLDGSVITDATLDVSSVSLTIGARAADDTALEALQDDVDEAFSQLVYTATLVVNGRPRVWECDCADIAWADFEPGTADAVMSTATVTVQVQPNRGSA
jgi:hypothetical protein